MLNPRPGELLHVNVPVLTFSNPCHCNTRKYICWSRESTLN